MVTEGDMQASKKKKQQSCRAMMPMYHSSGHHSPVGHNSDMRSLKVTNSSLVDLMAYSVKTSLKIIAMSF